MQGAQVGTSSPHKSNDLAERAATDEGAAAAFAHAGVAFAACVAGTLVARTNATATAAWKVTGALEAAPSAAERFDALSTGGDQYRYDEAEVENCGAREQRTDQDLSVCKIPNAEKKPTKFAEFLCVLPKLDRLRKDTDEQGKARDQSCSQSRANSEETRQLAHLRPSILCLDDALHVSALPLTLRGFFESLLSLRIQSKRLLKHTHSGGRYQTRQQRQ